MIIIWVKAPYVANQHDRVVVAARLNSVDLRKKLYLPRVCLAFLFFFQGIGVLSTETENHRGSSIYPWANNLWIGRVIIPRSVRHVFANVGLATCSFANVCTDFFFHSLYVDFLHYLVQTHLSYCVVGKSIIEIMRLTSAQENAVINVWLNRID